MTSPLGQVARWLLVASAASVTIGVAAPSQAQEASRNEKADKVDKKECVAAYEEGQRLRKESKLSDARTRLLVCAQDGCPSSIRRDCTQWVSEIEASTPTLVLEAVGEGGHDLFDVRVFLDGKPVGERLDGKAVNVDPGAHVVRFERAGAAPIEERVLAREGEKNRRVVAKFGSAASAAAVSASGSTYVPITPTSGGRHATPASVFIVGGVGLLGFATFGYFGALGLSAKSDLDKLGCKPSCDSSEVERAKRRFIIADIGLGVGIVGLGIATVLFVTRETSSPPPADAKAWKLDVSPTPGGAKAGFSGAF